MSIETLAFLTYSSIESFKFEIEKLRKARASDIDNLLDKYNLDYYDLPQFIKDKIDKIDLID